MAVAVTFASLVAAMLAGVPIAFALIGVGAVGIWLVTGDWNVVLGIIKTAPYRTASSYTLVTVPMFILMAFFTSSGGLARDLYGAVANWMSHLRGGLAIATVFACAIFGAMSGASVAAATVMSAIAIPNMRRFGYSDVLAAGAVGVGSTLDILIPPSVTMVVYGIATETSIGKLLMAGVVPGLLLGVLLSITIWVWVTLRPALAPPVQRVMWVDRWRSLRGVWPSLLLVVLLILFLYTGIVTPTELGAIGAMAAAGISVALGRLNLRAAVEAIQAAARSSAMIFMILIGASIFGYFLTLSRVPQQMVEAVAAANLSRWVVMGAIVVTYFVISMFMDELPLMLLSLPFTFPLVLKLGFDPVWFGVISMLMVAMGLIFPPVGLIAFVVSSTARVDLVNVYRGTTVLLIPLIITLVLLMIFPEIALWLPEAME